jgi:hypothetical protein
VRTRIPKAPKLSSFAWPDPYAEDSTAHASHCKTIAPVLRGRCCAVAARGERCDNLGLRDKEVGQLSGDGIGGSDGST